MLTVIGGRRHSGDDAGFTLIELTISIGILGLIMVAVTGVFAVAVRTNAGTDTRLTESLDLQFAASYFADDVAGAQSFRTGSAPGCGTDPAAIEVVELRGQTFDGFTPPVMQTTITTYVLRSVTVNGVATGQLHRLTCSAPSSPAPSLPLTPDRDVTVTRHLSSTMPGVNCQDATGAAASCSAAGVGAAVSVSVLLTSRSGDLTGTLAGRRRTS
jgi:prepilin-type N-terminal cleavage/methylation domain-containing protein